MKLQTDSDAPSGFNPTDAQVRQDKDVLEARTWLTTNDHPSALAGNRFDSTAQALAFVEKLYDLGAAKVTVDHIYAEPWRIKKEGGPYADTLLVEVPPDRAKRARLFALFNQEAQRAGEEAHHDASQRIVLLWWD